MSHSNTETTTKKGPQRFAGFEIRLVIFGFMIVAIIFRIFFPSEWIKVEYRPTYGKTYYLKTDRDFYYKYATEPYCSRNKETEGCAEKGEDASEQLSSGPINTKGLWFKSTNGENGVLWIEQKKSK